MVLAEPLRSAVQNALRDSGDGSPIEAADPVGGGMISTALRVTTGRHDYFLKVDRRLLPGFFSLEARGLDLIRHTGTVRVPQVIAAVDATPGQHGFIMMEWIASGRPGPDAGIRLGRAVAEMHRQSAALQPAQKAYGLAQANYLGNSVQHGGWDTDWPRFFRDRRLHPQVESARQRGLLPPALSADLDRVLDRVEAWLGGVERQPALLHGDLWHGNVLFDQSGDPVLFDPAVYYGDREAELAYTELFGGIPAGFMRGYEDVWPAAVDRDERSDLYNLYHLLNHLNIFGESYLAHVATVVRRYAG
jgi:fructosamine-3-kinase